MSEIWLHKYLTKPAVRIDSAVHCVSEPTIRPLPLKKRRPASTTTHQRNSNHMSRGPPLLRRFYIGICIPGLPIARLVKKCFFLYGLVNTIQTLLGTTKLPSTTVHNFRIILYYQFETDTQIIHHDLDLQCAPLRTSS